MSAATMNYKALPISKRIQLVEDIWDSIAEETSSPLQLSAEERAELHRRLAAHRADPSSGISWEQVRAGLADRATDPEGIALALARDAEITSGSVNPISHAEFLRRTSGAA